MASTRFKGCSLKNGLIAMKIFLLGAHEQNAGPSNVNKSLIKNSRGYLAYTHSKNRALRAAETILRIFSSDVILISGSCAKRYLRIIKLLGKKYYYLMHGCIEYENEINKLGLSDTAIKTEKEILEGAEKIICVSEVYSKWVKERFPQYKYKITFVNNGVNIKQRKKCEKEPYTLAIAGGNRRIKNNLEVCHAVDILNNKGYNFKLFIFGRWYPDNDAIKENDHIIICGHLNKEEYYEKLDKIDCFIINSEVESFGLVVADALDCNCSLLMSKNAGCQSILKVKNEDVIQNPHNIDELTTKILYVMDHPNSDRLYNSVDRENCSEQSSYKKIIDIIEGLGM
jgi:glycosyltransferase involved in cell wall biosynthesis